MAPVQRGDQDAASRAVRVLRERQSSLRPSLVISLTPEPQIWNDPKGLTPLQKHVVLNHIDDLRAASHCKGPLQLARRSPVYAIFRYAWIVSTLLVRTFVANPSVPFTNPVDWALSLVAYAVVFVALLVVQAIFTIGASARTPSPYPR